MKKPAQLLDPELLASRSRQVCNDALPAADLCLVSCVKTKNNHRAPAKDLYVSDWFCKARAVVELVGWPWFILSAEYGLVDPEAVIEPYEKTLNRMRKSERVEWASRVMDALDPSLSGVDSIVVFAGEKYREFLVPELHKRGITVHVPMACKGQGKQLAQLKRWLDR